MGTENITFYQGKVPSTSFTAFEDMREKGELCDVTLRVQDHTIVAHRIILAAAIPFFRQLFMKLSSKTEEKTVIIENLDHRAVKSLICFAYGTKITICAKNVCSLLLASKFLELSEIANVCTEFLSKRLHLNVGKVSGLALNLRDSNLNENVINYVRENFEVFVKSDCFLRLSSSYVKEIISKDDLNVTSEEIVLDAVLNWVMFSPFERNRLLPELLDEVRMIYCDDNYLVDKMNFDKFSEYFIPYVNLGDDIKKRQFLQKERKKERTSEIRPRKFYSQRCNLYGVCQYSNFRTTVHLYDFIDDIWHNISSIVQKDYFGNAIAVNEKIYMFLSETIQTFHVKTMKWEILEPRHKHILGAIVLALDNTIYCFGSIFVDFINKVRAFDTEQNKWLKEDKVSTVRMFAAAASLGKCVYITGGYWREKHHWTAEKYDPSTCRWSDISSMLYPRSHHASTSMNGKIYVCGGWTGHFYSRTAEVYDPLTRQWNLLDPMNIGRELFFLISYNKKIYALGGQSQFSTYSNCVYVEIYDSDYKKWTFDFLLPLEFQCALLVPIS